MRKTCVFFWVNGRRIRDWLPHCCANVLQLPDWLFTKHILCKKALVAMTTLCPSFSLSHSHGRVKQRRSSRIIQRDFIYVCVINSILLKYLSYPGNEKVCKCYEYIICEWNSMKVPDHNHLAFFSHLIFLKSLIYYIIIISQQFCVNGNSINSSSFV